MYILGVRGNNMYECIIFCVISFSVPTLDVDMTVIGWERYMCVLCTFSRYIKQNMGTYISTTLKTYRKFI